MPTPPMKDEQPFWCDLHYLYAETSKVLLEADPKLRRNFPKSVIVCATFNFGPHTVSLPPRDWHTTWRSASILYAVHIGASVSLGI